MPLTGEIVALKLELEHELDNRLLPFWLNHSIDKKFGGFMGRITSNMEVDEFAPKAAVLNTRILWSFSSAFNFSGKAEYLEAADSAFEYIRDHFIDQKYGGIYWLLDHQGNALNDRKQGYALSFAIYALAEYYIASSNKEALFMAINTFHDIEDHFFDEHSNGYTEALSRDWQTLDDMRLSDKDLNAPFTMNTHLHILEAYTRLLQVWREPFLENQLSNLLEIHLKKIVDKKTSHLKLFFDKDWNSISQVISYGHDIEAAWLMHEAAKAIRKSDLIQRIEPLVVSIARLTLNEGIAEDGSMIYEGNEKGVYDRDRHWWPQFEAMVGFLDAYELTGDLKYWKTVLGLWNFLKKHLQHPTGEWWWRVDEKYVQNPEDDLIGPWKGPYHNSRALIEVVKRTNRIFKKESND